MMYTWQKADARRRAAKSAGKRRGFTLIELIVVIAILAVLAAMMVPLVGKYVSDAKDAAGNANARAVYAAAAAAAAMDIAEDGTAESVYKTAALEAYFGKTDGILGATVDPATGQVIKATYKDGSKTYTYP